MAKSKKVKIEAMSIAQLVDHIQKQVDVQTGVVNHHVSRIESICKKKPRATLKEEVVTESNLASTLAKILHKVQHNTLVISETSASINL
jgi:ABC-type transporter Mla maintaining outer membrane lipid asymmetry ATPase subunit MlaF